MQISFRLLLILAKTANDKEAEKALAVYQGLTHLTTKTCTIRIWSVGDSYQVQLTSQEESNETLVQ